MRYVMPGAIPYMAEARNEDCAETAALLGAAWPGVRIIKLKCDLDCRSLECVEPERNGGMFVSLEASGTFEALSSARLITRDDLPAEGRKSRTKGWFQVFVAKAGYRLDIIIRDGGTYDALDESIQRAWDVMAAAIAPQLWRPSTIA